MCDAASKARKNSSTAESLDLGGSNDVLTLFSMSINGTNYTQAGTYTTNSWLGALAPRNVVGHGAVFIKPAGSVIMFR